MDAIATLHHVNLKTTRLREMIDWYGTVVGLKPQHVAPIGAFLTNDAASHRLALFAFPAMSDDVDKDSHTGIHHKVCRARARQACLFHRATSKITARVVVCGPASYLTCALAKSQSLSVHEM